MSFFYFDKIIRKPNFEMKQNHAHDFWEIYYLYQGNIRYFIKDTIFPLRENSLVIIKKNILHRTRYENDTMHGRILLNFDDSYFDEICKNFPFEKISEILVCPVISLEEDDKFFMEKILLDIEQEYHHEDSFSQARIASLMTELLIFILRKLCYSQDTLQKRKKFLSSEDLVIEKAAQYISTHFKEPISLGFMANFVNLSPQYFSKKFHVSTGFGFKEYLLHLRIQEACKLLSRTQKTVTEIAFECGFNDGNYFGNIFTKIKGISPLQYRKKLLAKKL